MDTNPNDVDWFEHWRYLLAGSEVAASAFEFQLNLLRSQSRSAQEIKQNTLNQAVNLLAYSIASVPFYQKQSYQKLLSKIAQDGKFWSDLPIITRDMLLKQKKQLKSYRLPAGHKITGRLRSSGSTGTAIEVASTNISNMWQKAFALRSAIWHRREFDQTLALIRKFSTPATKLPDGETSGHWADVEGFPFQTGKRFALEVTQSSIEEQYEWIMRKDPAYLMTFPSILRELCALSANRPSGWTPRGIVSFGETVDEELRNAVHDCWKLDIHDTYSSEECGVIAIQCNHGGNYHIQSEAVLVEIVDEQGQTCDAGEEGQVVVTTLANFATPLVRYAIGDRAIAGTSCQCGRNLPVISQLLGRERNLLVTPNGNFWPSFGMRKFREIVPVTSQQFRQVTLTKVEMRYVCSSNLTKQQKLDLRNHIKSNLPEGFDVELTKVEAIERGPSGKAEIFICEVDSNIH